MASVPTILLIDDDPELARLLARTLRDVDPILELEVAGTAGDGETALAEHSAACVLLDYRLPDATGLECLRRLRRIAPEVPVIMLTGTDSTTVAVEAMKLGATDYVVKHDRYLRVVAVKVREALGQRTLARVTRRADDGAARPAGRGGAVDSPPGFEAIVGESAALRAALSLVERAARSTVPVLLEGESGAGKELFARAIHDHGAGRSGVFLAQNCAALPESLLESELFGHVRGAFTGADRDRRGLFEAASGGTLFLDEIGEASLGIQAKLLRVLQDHEVRPLGATTSRVVDVRIVSATNMDLAAAVRDGRFRQDLYYRLRVFPIRVPSLRERTGDIPLLLRRFVTDVAAHEGVPPPEFSPAALEALERYAWPGNVREFQNEIHRVVLCAEPGTPITLEALSPGIAATALARPAADRALKSIVQDIEVAIILARLREHGYNREETARSLGITREALWAKMRKLGLEVARRGPEDAGGEVEKE